MICNLLVSKKSDKRKERILKKMQRHLRHEARNRKLTSIEGAKVPMKAYCPISLAFIGNFTMNLHEENEPSETKK